MYVLQIFSSSLFRVFSLNKGNAALKVFNGKVLTGPKIEVLVHESRSMNETFFSVSPIAKRFYFYYFLSYEAGIFSSLSVLLGRLYTRMFKRLK